VRTGKGAGMDGKYTAERVTPTVQGWSLAGVVLLLALGSGLTVFVGAGLLVWALGWSVKVALGSSGVCVLLVWGALLLRVGDLLTTVETVEPWVQQEPERVAPVVSVEVSDLDRGRWRFADLPVDVDRLRQLASGVLSGRSLSEADWTGKGALFSRSEFRTLRGALLEREFCQWRNDDAPQQGLELTPVGTRVFGALAEGVRTSAHVRGGSSGALVAPDREGGS